MAAGSNFLCESSAASWQIPSFQEVQETSVEMLEGRGLVAPIVFGVSWLWRSSLSHSTNILLCIWFQRFVGVGMHVLFGLCRGVSRFGLSNFHIRVCIAVAIKRETSSNNCTPIYLSALFILFDVSTFVVCLMFSIVFCMVAFFQWLLPCFLLVFSVWKIALVYHRGNSDEGEEDEDTADGGDSAIARRAKAKKAFKAEAEYESDVSLQLRLRWPFPSFCIYSHEGFGNIPKGWFLPLSFDL